MLPKTYNPAATEDRIYTMWEESGVFTADPNSKKEVFSIAMPPPNATGNLHLGHAVMLALEDIFSRFERMRGKEVLWLPGTDHAAIATENVVIRMLREQGMKDPRKELGREKLVQKIAEYVEGSRHTIRSQIRKMGSSCDWTRERYTFEPALNRIVNEVFAKMHRDGLIYRGHRIINWDPKLQTTVSDYEIEWVEEKVPFYTFRYGPFEIGTVRPETKFGDKYVVMHPDDARYKKYKHDETLEVEWINGPIRATIIKDAAVDPAFGTGVMTITPWHTQIDFEIAERHGLEKEQIIGFDGKLLPVAGEFAGMPIEKARPLIVEKLEKKGLLIKIDQEYVHSKAVSQRGKATIEPQIKLQWFIDVNKEVVSWKNQTMSLKQVMHDVVRHGDITIIPDRFAKVYFHWIDNLRDWCISRQIWWGHRIPVWYKGDQTYVGVSSPEGKGWEQDPDTLDTWFSSALWTWSTLIDPKLTEDPSLSLEEMLRRSPDFRKFHPTAVLETGYDILPFWVTRMILMTTYALGQIPFRTVYLHGLIRTREGKKMSKSDPKTMIDPLDMIAKYGADALRLSMIVGQGPGADSRLYEEKIAGYRNFVNKLWNASRFVLMECEKAGLRPQDIGHRTSDRGAQSLADRALLSMLQRLIKDGTEGLEEYRLSEVGERLYSFVWDFFCDWYLELSKGTATMDVLVHTIRTILILLHPYCPFITEELWVMLRPTGAEMLLKTPWPEGNQKLLDDDAEMYMRILIETIQTVRRLRADNNIEHGKEVSITLVTQKWVPLLESQEAHIRRLAKVDSLTIETGPCTPSKDMVSAFFEGIEVRLSLAGLIDRTKERANIEKERAQLTTYIADIEAKLARKDFVDRAPADLVEQEREKLQASQERLRKIEERLKTITE